MIPSLEVLLCAGILAFYLQDSALLLYFDDLVFERAGKRWHASTGRSQWSGRFLFLPNPLTPWRALFRGSWLAPPTGEAGGAVERLEPFLQALRPLRIGVAVLGALLLVGVPVLLWAFPHPGALLALVAAIYATTLLLGIPLWRRRHAYGLDRKTAAWLALECVACPPHAINLVRKLGLRQPLPGDLFAFASASLEPAALAALKAALTERAAMTATDAGDTALDRRLQGVRRHLEALAP